jgi:hypothetical protein
MQSYAYLIVSTGILFIVVCLSSNLPGPTFVKLFGFVLILYKSHGIDAD